MLKFDLVSFTWGAVAVVIALLAILSPFLGG